MAIRIADEYVNSHPADTDYPHGSFKNSTSPTSRDGTPLEAAWPNDIQGFLQGILAAGGVTPSGEPDTAVASDYLDALRAIFATAAQGAKADSALQTNTALVIGELREFAFQSPPAKWLELGQAVSRTTYAALFAAIGTTWGPGNGTTTFDLPPRGYFTRSWDHGAGVDPARAFGSIQADEIKAHTHAITAGTSNNVTGTHIISASDVTSIQAGATLAAGSTETRPKNIAVLVCIYAGV
jgi:microcystin-dependent protein